MMVLTCSRAAGKSIASASAVSTSDGVRSQMAHRRSSAHTMARPVAGSAPPFSVDHALDRHFTVPLSG